MKNIQKKKEVAKKMSSKIACSACGSIGHSTPEHKNRHSEGNYKKHLDKVYKEEDNFSTRKGE